MADAMKLLPCPMCGGEAALLDYEARYGGLHYASRCPQCASCGCSMGYLPTAKKAVEAWNRRASMPPEKNPSFDDARRKLIHCIEQWDGETEYDAEDIAALADDILDVFASPPAREEAPAEGAGEYWYDMPGVLVRLQDCLDDANPDRPNVSVDTGDLRAALSALRNRTSEPEAGECITTQSMNDAASDPVWCAKWNRDPSDHPAPATTDKLKEGRSLIEDAIKGIQKAPLSVVTDTIWTADPCPMTVVDALQLALAALNEQPQ